MIIAKEKQAIAINMATQDLNFYGKRMRSSRLSVAEKISIALYDTGKFSKEICDFLEANQPVKAKKERGIKQVEIDSRPVASGTLNTSNEQWEVKQGKKFIISSAQNNTFVHSNFLKSLKQYAEYLGAELLISKFLYNKNAFQNGSGSKEEIKFNDDLKPYLLDKNVYLNNRSVAFMAEINILPTADYPLSGFAETATALDIETLLIGHAKISAESVPALKGDVVRRMYSTGTTTQKNYIQQKAGQKAEALHNFGALIVEFDDAGNCFVRQLETMDSSGEFYDLNLMITQDAVFPTEGHVLGLQYGDIHAEKLDPLVAGVSWDEHSDHSDLNCSVTLLDYLRPKNQLIHDVHDFTSRNHHNRNSGSFLAKQYAAGRDKVIDDLKDTGAVLEAMERVFSQTIIVESNHDLALERWLDDPKNNIHLDPANAPLYYTLNAARFEAIAAQDETFNVLDYALRELSGYDFSAVFLRTDDSFKLAGIECGVHGHNGINGSRGNPKQFKKLGKLNTGHTHTAGIYGGVYVAGVSGSLDMGYNIGASSWSQTHIITYANGQRTLIDIKDGKFCATDI